MTCSLTPWPSTAGKATASKAPGAVLPGGAGLFQAWQLPPAAPLQMAAGSGMVSLGRERFPREKGGFDPRRSHGHCCQADCRRCFLAGIYFLEKTESSVKRSGKALVLLCFTSSISGTMPSRGTTSSSQRKKYQPQI